MKIQTWRSADGERIEINVLGRWGKDKETVRADLKHRSSLGLFVRVNRNILNEFVFCKSSNLIVYTWVKNEEDGVFLNLGGKRFLNLEMGRLVESLLKGIDLD